jgi:putative membrane protein
MSEPSLGVAVPDTRLHPIYLIIGTAKTLRQAIPVLVVTIFGGAPWWVNVGLFALVMVVAIAQWHVKKYSVVGGVLLLRSGLVNQSVRVVPVTRITALAAFQSLTQRLVGVWGLNVHSPGDRNGSAVTLACLSGRRLDELRAAVETGGRTTVLTNPKPGPGPSTIERYLAWRRTSVASGPAHGLHVIAVLTTVEMLIAAVTNSTVSLILVVVLVAWFRFSDYLPIRASEFMEEIVEPEGVVAVLITLVVVAITAGVVLGALRLNRFTLVRDGDVLRNSRGLFGKQTATIPVKRIQAVRIVEGLWRMLLGYCSLQVEVAGIGRTNTNQRMLFPLVRTDRVEALIRRALPELPWPSQPLLILPARVHRRYLTLPLEYAMGFTLLMLFLPGWWELLAIFPLPLGYVLGVARAREARWWIDDQSVVLRWRWLLDRNTVIAHRYGTHLTELSSSPWKARAGVAGFKMRFSSGRGAEIRYMADSDALLLLHTVGRAGERMSAHVMRPTDTEPVVPSNRDEAPAVRGSQHNNSDHAR